MSRKLAWFDRGRDAFTEGRPCFIADGRASGKDRQDWYDGWKHQQNLNTPPASEEARAATIAELESIKNEIISLP